jgi:transcriptional regulator with XRE-family HTH domain
MLVVMKNTDRRIPVELRQDLPDRMAKSLLAKGLSVQQMADLLEVNRNTVGAWINRRNKPSRQTLKLWAQYTDVPYEWLRDGTWPKDNPGHSSQLTLVSQV